MTAKQNQIISDGCKLKEIRRLNELKSRKSNPIWIIAKETELYIIAKYRLKLNRKGVQKCSNFQRKSLYKTYE